MSYDDDIKDTYKFVPEPGTIKFKTSGTEVLRFEPNGDCYVRGELVENNQDIWLAVKHWLEKVVK